MPTPSNRSSAQKGKHGKRDGDESSPRQREANAEQPVPINVSCVCMAIESFIRVIDSPNVQGPTSNVHPAEDSQAALAPSRRRGTILPASTIGDGVRIARQDYRSLRSARGSSVRDAEVEAPSRRVRFPTLPTRSDLPEGVSTSRLVSRSTRHATRLLLDVGDNEPTVLERSRSRSPLRPQPTSSSLLRASSSYQSARDIEKLPTLEETIQEIGSIEKTPWRSTRPKAMTASECNDFEIAL
jgi:hypothetical protein